MFEFIKTFSAFHGNRKPGWHPSSTCHTVLDVITFGTGDWTQDLTYAIHVLRHGTIPLLPEKSLPPCHVSLKPCSSSVRSSKDDIASWKKVVTWSVCRVVWDVGGEELWTEVCRGSRIAASPLPGRPRGIQLVVHPHKPLFFLICKEDDDTS